MIFESMALWTSRPQLAQLGHKQPIELSDVPGYQEYKL